MVKKRIYILTLSFIFLVSTTGMPLIIHYCKMMESASLKACEMHSQEIKKSNCCETENQSSAAAKSSFSKAIDECCKDFVVDLSVKDTFVSSKTEFNIPVYLYTHILFDSDLTSPVQTNLKLDISPPLHFGNKIYLNTSVLLI